MQEFYPDRDSPKKMVPARVPIFCATPDEESIGQSGTSPYGLRKRFLPGGVLRSMMRALRATAPNLLFIKLNYSSILQSRRIAVVSFVHDANCFRNLW